MGEAGRVLYRNGRIQGKSKLSLGLSRAVRWVRKDQVSVARCLVTEWATSIGVDGCLGLGRDREEIGRAHV